MSSFPKHVDNIENMKNLGFEVGDCYENGEVTLESWGYDYLVDLMSDLIGRIQQLEHDNKTLKASLSLCQEQNKGMLEMLKKAVDNVASWGSYASEYFQQKWSLDEDIKNLEDFIAKIESQKEGNEVPEQEAGQECNHSWCYQGHGHNYDVYGCMKCGAQKEE